MGSDGFKMQARGKSAETGEEAAPVTELGRAISASKQSQQPKSQTGAVISAAIRPITD